MLPKNKRLDKQAFDFVYQNGKNVNGSIGYLKVLPDYGTTQVSCTTGKKQTKNSVDRTRIRRRGYAAVADNFNLIPAGMAVIWFLPQNTADIEYEALSAGFKSMIESLNTV